MYWGVWGATRAATRAVNRKHKPPNKRRGREVQHQYEEEQEEQEEYFSPGVPMGIRRGIKTVFTPVQFGFAVVLIKYLYRSTQVPSWCHNKVACASAYQVHYSTLAGQAIVLWILVDLLFVALVMALRNYYK